MLSVIRANKQLQTNQNTPEDRPIRGQSSAQHTKPIKSYYRFLLNHRNKTNLTESTSRPSCTANAAQTITT